MRCKHCRKKVEDNYKTIPLGQVHNECWDDYVQSIFDKNREKKKKNKIEMKKAKIENKRSKAKQTVWNYFSQFIRLRDSDKKGYGQCITCGDRRFWKDFVDAGHYIPKSTGEYFYFNEDNVHFQCRSCNGYQGGKQKEFRKALIKKIGLKKVEELDRLQKERPILKRSLKDYEDLKNKYRELTKSKLNDMIS